MLDQRIRSLLANIICEKTSSYIVDEIINRFATMSELLNATQDEFVTVPGIGPAKANAIISALQLSRMLLEPLDMPTIIRKPDDVFEFVKAKMMFLPKEHFVTLFLNTKNHIIAEETISIGSLDAAIVHPRCVYRAAIKRNSSLSIICVHNHPSGDPQPSKEDIDFTTRLAEAGSIVGIELLDHCIIGHNRFTSLKECGHF